ncbi:MAG: branched-chain amino acid ABC transporter permease [Propionivibrio sp.]|nr:branched-chain amino acid ABC transporter permease [Propionivibrio sp.]
MTALFDIPIQALMGQLMLGLVNGSFYATLSLGLAVIFGMLNIINFAHGALYMMGAFLAWMGLEYLGIGYWPSLILVPLAVGLFGVLIERSMLRWLYKLDHLYGLLLTFGLALVIEGLFINGYGVSGQPYQIPAELTGGFNLGFMFLPYYRGWVIFASLLVCFGTWYGIEKTRLGAYLRAATENPKLTQAFGINVPLMVMLTYGFGAALAGFAGVLAAPAIQVSPLMGSHLIIIVFAVVVIGGMGSILGSILTGLGLGVVEGLTNLLYPAASATVVFVIMAIVLMVRPAGLFGKKNEQTGDRVHRAAGLGSACALLYLPGTGHEGAVFCPVRLCLQPAARLYRIALLRPCRFLRHGRLRRRLCHQGLGVPARTGHPRRHRRVRPAGLGLWQPGDTPHRHLLCDGHAGAGADGLFRLPAGALHGRRRRPPGRAARNLAGTDQPFQGHQSLLFRAGGIRLRLLPDSPHHPFAFRPDSQGHPRKRATGDLARL